MPVDMGAASGGILEGETSLEYKNVLRYVQGQQHANIIGTIVMGVVQKDKIIQWFGTPLPIGGRCAHISIIFSGELAQHGYRHNGYGVVPGQ